MNATDLQVVGCLLPSCCCSKHFWGHKRPGVRQHPLSSQPHTNWHAPCNQYSAAQGNRFRYWLPGLSRDLGLGLHVARVPAFGLTAGVSCSCSHPESPAVTAGELTPGKHQMQIRSVVENSPALGKACITVSQLLWSSVSSRKCSKVNLRRFSTMLSASPTSLSLKCTRIISFL